MPERRIVSEADVNVAGHEFNHAWVGMSVGYLPELISIIPEGNSLGRTVFYGDIPPSVFQVMAAAGAVAAPHQSYAEGYGMDLFMVNAVGGSYSQQEAIGQASSIISGCPAPIRRRIAEIIAFKKEVSSGEIPLIIEQAKFELMVEGLRQEDREWEKDVWNYRTPDRRLFVPPEDKEITSKIEITGEDDKYQWVIVTGSNRPPKELQVCKACGESNGHSPHCLINSQERNKQPKHENPTIAAPVEKEESVSEFPPEDRIFDGSRDRPVPPVEPPPKVILSGSILLSGGTAP